MNEWSEYYENKTEVVGLNNLRLHYGYVLDQFSELVCWKNKRPKVVLGGINPNATRPEDFESLVANAFGEAETIIVDKNQVALEAVQGSNSKAVLANLEDLPASLEEISLLLCDFTVDFMSDEEIARFAKSISKHLSKNGLLVAAIYNPVSSRLNAAHYKYSYGVDVYNRTAIRLIELMGGLKPVYIADTEKDSTILVFGRADCPQPDCKGRVDFIGNESPEFYSWAKTKGKRYL